MLTIGQLANYAGVTIKAIRHYHERGLLAEPDRDSSGYRRYTAADAIELVKIKTLADAGVPLARVKELLDTDPDTLTAAITEIDHDLQDRMAQLRRTRDRLAQLSGGDRLFGNGSPTATADQRPAPSTTPASPGWPRNPSPELHPQPGTAWPNS